MASRYREKAPMARRATAGARSSGLVRSFQSLSITKAIPMFWPRPAKLKPETVMIDSTALVSPSRKWRSSCSMTFIVRSWVAPAGSCTWQTMKPWSSSGRNEVGSRRKSTAIAATIAP